MAATILPFTGAQVANGQTVNARHEAVLDYTYRIAYAAATDVGDRHMRLAGRTKWNRTDHQAASDAFHRLLPDLRQH
jgi:hypothetical protein